MIIEDNIKVARLLDVYGSLLTDKQHKIMSFYYFDNLTLSEIADNLNITRQAVNDCLTQATNSLENYEKELCILKKHDNLKLRINNMLKKSTNEDLNNKLQEILEMLDE